MCASSEGSGETALMRRLDGALTACLVQGDYFMCASSEGSVEPALHMRGLERALAASLAQSDLSTRNFRFCFQFHHGIAMGILQTMWISRMCCLISICNVLPQQN